MPIKSRIRTIADFPKAGIMYRDITTLLKDPLGLKITVDSLVKRYSDMEIDVVAGIEARGFIIGAPIAMALGKGFIPIRKKGKLPGETYSQDYQLEYGVDTIEIHTDAFEKGQRVLMVDDLLATGGTMVGAIELVEKAGAVPVHACFIVDLPELKGGVRLKEKGMGFYALTEFDGH
ncbi:MAG: adenine phosphoribosyltransferase [Bacteriovoracaceae bacterium]|jgi:adenine phosphoribosyltransferase|nr:adenine phosphoribosyltransferase [Bacteriovoracaceae bacterium]